MNPKLTRRALFKALRSSQEDAPPEERVAQIGDACVEPRGVMCRRCGEACDPGAIKFRLMRGGAQTVLDISRCTGCGECAAVCPVGGIALVNRDRALAAASLAFDLAQNPAKGSSA
ncbi:MAG: 4Fe-4S dicluster domain-containing protein [Rhodoblastus sp.]